MGHRVAMTWRINYVSTFFLLHLGCIKSVISGYSLIWTSWICESWCLFLNCIKHMTVPVKLPRNYKEVKGRWCVEGAETAWMKPGHWNWKEEVGTNDAQLHVELLCWFHCHLWRGNIQSDGLRFITIPPLQSTQACYIQVVGTEPRQILGALF